jgi:hypothetical protein
MNKRFVLTPILGVLLVVVVLFAGACLYVKWQAWETRRNAEILLVELRKLKVGETTLKDVRQLVARTQSRFLAKGSDPFCQYGFCTFTFAYYTGILGKFSYWHLHPWRLYLTPAPVGFLANLVVHGDRLVRIGMLLSSDVTPLILSANVTDEVPEISPVHEPYIYEVRHSEISIYIKPTATAAQREAAYSFNLHCMDEIGGCRDETLLLPKPQ